MEANVDSVKFYRNGFRLIKMNNTNKFYKFEQITEIRLCDDTIEIINWRIIDGEKQDRILTMDRIWDDNDVGQKIMDYWKRYHNITLSFVPLTDQVKFRISVSK